MDFHTEATKSPLVVLAQFRSHETMIELHHERLNLVLSHQVVEREGRVLATRKGNNRIVRVAASVLIE
jgi:hypothetical protein